MIRLAGRLEYTSATKVDLMGGYLDIFFSEAIKTALILYR